ncbi:hypothetical protein [Nostoc sp. PA-18-2419]|uniref:hypothetical protein n=1 Tax=Nostoc sp. PA-18-2419 TaxID=2575443 RepID=UPI001109FE0D|nr:hypothetical protein [Nostoc sp. PA-18-2419]
MANYVENYLTVEGSNQSVKAFFERANTNQSLFDFNAFVPMPPNIFQGDLGAEEEQMYPGEQNWYGWSISNWGTSSRGYTVVHKPPFVQLRTVWSVPLPVLLAASEQFPDLKFTNEWIESTLEAAGRFILQSGQIWLDESENYEMWSNKQSKYIHPLNLKYCKSEYIKHLKEFAVEEPGDDSPYVFYLNASNGRGTFWRLAHISKFLLKSIEKLFS